MSGVAAGTCPTFPMPRDRAHPLAPPPELVALRDAAPVTRVTLWDGNTAWLISRYEDQRRLLADDRFSADVRRPGFPQSAAATATWFQRARPLMTMDNPEHDTLRRSMARAFTIRQVEALRPGVQRLVDDLLDEMLASGSPADLVPAFARPLPSLVICELLGVPYEDHDFFQATAATVVSTSSTLEESSQAVDDLRGYVAALIESRGQEPGTDLLGSIISDQYLTGRYSLEETSAIALQLLLAGHDTTANMIALGTLALLQNPDQLALLVSGTVPVASAVEELLRFLNIVHTGRRRVALEDVEIHGQVIAAGEGIIAPSDVSNRESGVFAHPDSLDLTRNPRNHLSFGYGIHQCLGAPLARMELQVAYGSLFSRIPSLRLATELTNLRYRDDSVVYGVRELPVAWDQGAQA
jgi:cytochrome P450